MWLNALLIETVEETPDTYITLVTGKRLIVLERATDIILLVKQYNQEIGVNNATIKVQQTEETS